MQEINEAYEVLRNPTKRERYDRERSTQSSWFAKREGERQQKPQTDRVEHTRPGDTEKTLVNSIGMAFVLIPAGRFMMGSNDGSSDEKPAHEVRISQPFYLGQYQVTQGQWQAVMGNNPSRFKGEATLPVEKISWEEVQAFIRKLNAHEQGNRYRLPTEAEWEYAARAGSTTAYSYGDDARQLGEYAWYAPNAGAKTHPVGQKKPNAWGLYDMHGNVWEWVQDWYELYPSELATRLQEAGARGRRIFGSQDPSVSNAITDPQGPPAGSERVLRGGSWDYPASNCRSWSRNSGPPTIHSYSLGFRLLRIAP